MYYLKVPIPFLVPAEQQHLHPETYDSKEAQFRSKVQSILDDVKDNRLPSWAFSCEPQGVITWEDEKKVV